MSASAGHSKHDAASSKRSKSRPTRWSRRRRQQQLADGLTLYRGGREIRLLFLGRGHSGGDVVVHLPEQKVLITGDLLVECLPYMGDGHLAEWADTLERLKDLDFEWIVPGHGAAYQDRERITHLQAYLRDLWKRASEAYAAGVPAEVAAKQIDMTSHAAGLACIQEPGVDEHAVLRVYDLLSEAEKPAARHTAEP